MEDWTLRRIIEVVKGGRHRYYERTCELASLYDKLVTGRDVNDLMTQFVRRETPEQFDQRRRITQHITSTVCQTLMQPAYKIPRNVNAKRVIDYESDDARKAELEAKLSAYWGTKSVDDFMATRWIELNYVDPNAFCIIEWRAFDPTVERATPYPFEVKSQDVVDYLYENNILQYLIVRVDTEGVDSRGAKVHKYAYTYYDKTQAYTFVPVFDEALASQVINEDVLREMTIAGGMVTTQFIRIGRDNVFMVIEPEPYNLSAVPAFRIGYKRDMQTDGNTYVSPIDGATPILMSMIKSKSELDLSIALHTFPQKIQYVKRCHAEGCNGGYLSDMSTCPVCRGEGLSVATSAQEMIQLELPRSKEEMIELDNVVHYIQPPVDLLQFQDSYVKSLVAQCKEAIYNSDIYSRQEVAETATGKNISLQAVYDALYPMAIDYATDWEFTVRMIAEITGLDTGLTARYLFSKDFKLKGIDDLYADLSMVTNSGASSFVKQSIEDDIALVLYADDPEALRRYQVKQAFNPFSGKTNEQIIYLLSTNTVPMRQRVLWANQGWIFDSLEAEAEDAGIELYSLNTSRITEMVNAKLDEIVAALPSSQTPMYNAEF